MKENQTFNTKFFLFLGLTFFFGTFPLLLYPFSKYYGKENEYADFNHGPLHQYPDGDYFEAAPQGIEWVIDKIFIWPTLIMFFLSLLVFLYFLFSKKYKIGFSYLIPAFLSFCFIIFQSISLYWLFD